MPKVFPQRHLTDPTQTILDKARVFELDTSVEWRSNGCTRSFAIHTAIGCEQSETTALSTGGSTRFDTGLITVCTMLAVSFVLMVFCIISMLMILYTALEPSSNNDLAFTERCASAVSSRFLENGLLLNPDKMVKFSFGSTIWAIQPFAHTAFMCLLQTDLYSSWLNAVTTKKLGNNRLHITALFL